jgi:hypothetical protein
MSLVFMFIMPRCIMETIPNASNNNNNNNNNFFHDSLVFSHHSCRLPIPVAARSKAWVCGCSLTGIVGSNPAEDMDVSCECCVLLGRGLCDELVPRPEECYRVWCV